MKEYIEREVALHGMDANISHLRKVADENPLLNKAINLVQYTRDFIAALPAADVVERKRGEWLEGLVIQTDISALYDYTCSECGIVSSRESNFCPNCGADMRGEQHEAD